MITLSTTFKYINHACFMLCHEGHNIIFDPYLEGCPKFKPGDTEALKGLDVEYILISHAHFDHIVRTILRTFCQNHYQHYALCNLTWLVV